MAQDQRKKSQRLITTTPTTYVGAALESVKPQISPKLLEGLEIQKVSTSGDIGPRIFTLSDDLFTIFVSHHKVGSQERLRDRFHYKGFKAYKTIVKTLTGTTVQRKSGLRVIDIADILFVQSGFIGSRKLEECKYKEPDLNPRRAISIFHNNLNTTDLLIDDEEDRNAVLSAIQTIREAYHASSARVGREELLLRYAWYDTDWTKTGLVDQKEFIQLLARINIYVKHEEAIRMHKAYVASKYTTKGRIVGVKNPQKGITFDDCLYVLRRIKVMDLHHGVKLSDVIFDQVFGEKKDDVTAEEFLAKFLHERQGERNVTIGDVNRIFSELNAMELSGAIARTSGADGKGGGETIDRLRFGEYLTSSMNDLYDPERQKFDSLTLASPISHYWINSSHNTYLTGDQLKSSSTVEMYAVAMQRGCKCLELDCWDDSDEYPIVYHGYTLTSKIPFQDVITCVKAYVDANPKSLPIILSLENHCSRAFQEMMADILIKTLGERLCNPEISDRLPSPLDLVGKVVIKGKRPPENDDYEDLNSPESMEEIGSTLSSIDSGDTNSTKKVLPKIVPELARLTLFNGVKYKELSASIYLPLNDMHSLNESKVEKILNSDPASVPLWRKYNNDHMSRTYPSGTRVDSSNYNPVVAWHIGSQLVALNFQTDDSPMTINDGRFRENGCCGYIHKPPSVLSTDDETKSGKDMLLQIKILCGSCLPKPYGESVGEVIDPYVVVRLHDIKDIEQHEPGRRSVTNPSGQVEWEDITEYKTSSIRDNGFCPQWNDAEQFSFSVVDSDVAMLEFIVMDSDQGFIDDLMCKSAVPVSCLRRGLRSVQFYDHSSQHGPFGFARLLVDVDIKYMM